MNVFARIAAGLAAVVFTATAVGLPDVCRYCTVHALASTQAAHVAVQTNQPADGQLHARHALRVSLHAMFDQYRRPI